MTIREVIKEGCGRIKFTEQNTVRPKFITCIQMNCLGVVFFGLVTGLPLCPGPLVIVPGMDM